MAVLFMMTMISSTSQQQQQQQQQPEAAALLACTNQHPSCSSSNRTSWEHLLEDRHSCLVAAWARWSSRPAQLQVTLVTQLSINRLPQLRAQCQAWAGPLAAAVYLPLLNPEPELQDHALRKIRAAESDLEDLFLQSEAGAGSGLCQLRLLLVYEAFDQERTAAVLYPVNSLRNLARLMADTALIANIDVDMLPSLSLSSSLQGGSNAAGADPATYIKGCLEQKHVYVIPAFETSCGGPAYADAAVKHPKEELHSMISEQCLSQFREKVAPACHNVTDYPRWFKAVEPYAVEYKDEFEPWFISARTKAQWFDFRFRGYGKNKIAQVAATAGMSGSPFLVHPSGFLVHRQHTESPSRKAFLRVKFKSRKNAGMLVGSLYEHIEALWSEVQTHIANNTYHPTLDPGIHACLQALPWWKA